MNNDELMYKQKYLKYKHKYLELKQNGGFLKSISDKAKSVGNSMKETIKSAGNSAIENATVMKLGLLYNNNPDRCKTKLTIEKEDFTIKNRKEIEENRNKIKGMPDKLKRELELQRIKNEEEIAKIKSDNVKETTNLNEKLKKLEVDGSKKNEAFENDIVLCNKISKN